MEKNGYTLERQWWNFKLTTLEKVTAKHSEMYWYLIRQNNSFGWVESFGLPTDHTMDALKISYKTFSNVLNDLVRWGFVTVIERSRNQHYSSRIKLNLLMEFLPKQKNLLREFLPNQLPKQLPKQCRHNKTVETIQTEETFLNEKVNSLFLDFLRINKITDTLRITILAEGLEKLTPGNDDLKIDIIKQAIAGGHSDFRPLPGNKFSDTTSIGKEKYELKL